MQSTRIIIRKLGGEESVAQFTSGYAAVSMPESFAAGLNFKIVQNQDNTLVELLFQKLTTTELTEKIQAFIKKEMIAIVSKPIPMDPNYALILKTLGQCPDNDDLCIEMMVEIRSQSQTMKNITVESKPKENKTLVALLFDKLITPGLNENIESFIKDEITIILSNPVFPNSNYTFFLSKLGQEPSYDDLVMECMTITRKIAQNAPIDTILKILDNDKDKQIESIKIKQSGDHENSRAYYHR